MCYIVKCPFRFITGLFFFVWGWIFFQVILSETANRIFLAESGRKILSALIVKAQKVTCVLASIFIVVSVGLIIKMHLICNRKNSFCR